MSSKARTQAQSYVSVTGHNYISTETGDEARVDAGEIVTDMPSTSVELELAAGNLKSADDTSSVDEQEGGGN